MFSDVFKSLVVGKCKITNKTLVFGAAKFSSYRLIHFGKITCEMLEDRIDHYKNNKINNTS